MRNSKGSRKIISFVLILVSVILVDQLIKFIFVKFAPALLVKNSGVAFGLATPLWLILATFILLAGLALWSWYKNPDHWEARAISFALILGGALSNLLDRAWRGVVLDYIDLKIWPVFNLADAGIFIGALGLLWYAFTPTSTSSTSHGQKNKEQPTFIRERSAKASSKAEARGDNK